jgi:5-methyltetrahydrofolate--homocysteine methyltransferase
MGKDVEAQDILDKAVETNAAVIGLSALMTTTMMEMKHVVELAKEQKVKSKIIIGGAVVTDGFAKEIGADGYSEDAREAVKLVNRLLGKAE